MNHVTARQVNILFFGQLKDVTGTDSLVLENIRDTDGLIAVLQKQFPTLGSMRFVMAVDKRIIQQNTALQHNSSVAIMPPFSGG